MKLTYKDKGAYSEIGQPNPMRWAILSQNDDGTYKNESSWLKCKDFFNDYVVAYNGGKRFSIYSFTTIPMTIPTKGESVPMAVTYITPSFKNNMKVMNVWLAQQGHTIIEMEKDGDVYILTIPEFYFRSTYNISLISLMIRLCSTETKYNSFEAMIACKTFPGQDQNLWNPLVAKGLFFNIPDKLKKYIWYQGEQSNSENFKDDYNLASQIHNNGIISYMRHF